MMISSVTSAQINKAEIVATGLTCSMCSNAIYKQLQKIPSTEKVETNLNTNTFTVYLKKGNQTKPLELKENIEKAGFFVGSMIVYLPSESLKSKSETTLGQTKTSFVFLEGNAKIDKGQTKVKIIDKGYLTAKEFKKQSKVYAKKTNLSNSSADVYHVKSVE